MAPVEAAGSAPLSEQVVIYETAQAELAAVLAKRLVEKP
jgi:hypothetical protein